MLKKSIASVLILGYSALILVDGLPSGTVIHDNLKPMARRALNVLGQWQGNLKLFAPVPDRINVHLEGKLELSDGTEVPWRSPDWQNLTHYRRFVDYRMMRYVDSARLDTYSNTWGPLSAYLVNEAERSSGRKVKKITLSRHWSLIDEPKSPFYNPLVIPPHSLNYVFLQKDFSR